MQYYEVSAFHLQMLMNVFTIKYQMVDVVLHVIKMLFVPVALWVEDTFAHVMRDFLEMVSNAHVRRY